SPVFIAPRNELERMIAGIWCEVLGVEQVGIHDNFFDIGGHSLRIPQMHLKLHEKLGRDLPLVEFFQYSTVSALATHLGEGGDQESLAESEERGHERKRAFSQQRERRRAAGEF